MDHAENDHQISICYLSMLCEEGSHEHHVCRLHSEGADDGQWFARSLRRPSAVRLSTLSISNGASLPDPGLFDAMVLGGTFHSVHDDRPWQQALRKWLNAHRRTGKPLLGICGGHQVGTLSRSTDP